MSIKNEKKIVIFDLLIHLTINLRPFYYYVFKLN